MTEIELPRVLYEGLKRISLVDENLEIPLPFINAICRLYEAIVEDIAKEDRR